MSNFGFKTVHTTFKTEKRIGPDDIKELGITNIVFIDGGPVCLINDKRYLANSMVFDTLEKLTQYFITRPSIYFAMVPNPMNVFIKPEPVDMGKGDKLTITSGSLGEQHVFIADDNCELTFNYSEGDMYNKYIIRLYEEDDTKSDNFRHCDGVKCIETPTLEKMNEIIETEEQEK